MASFESQGLDDFINLAIFTDRQINSVVGRSIHPGAKLMANAIAKAINGIPVDDRKSHHYKGKRQGLTSAQKKGLVDSFGIARIRKTKYGWDVKVGFDGYNEIVTKRWKKGQPNAMVARSINSGTSFMIKYPFMDTTVKAHEGATVQKISDQFDRELDKIWNRAKF